MQLRFKRVHECECVGDRGGRGEQAVIAQHQEVLVAEIAHEARFFILVEREALVVVIAEC